MVRPGDWHLRADSDDDDDDIPEEYRHTKDSILWCIEATPTMLAPMLSPASSTQAGPTPSRSVRPSATQSLDWNGPPARSKMEECLRCAYAMMRRRVISSPKDLVSIMIWNCENKGTSETRSEDGCHILLDVQPITAHNIRMVKELLEKAQEDEDYLSQLFKPIEGGNAIGNALTNANGMFRERSPTAQNRIFWVTDNDDPLAGEEQLYGPIRKRREDLREMGYEIEPFFVPPTSDTEFDLEKFYGEFIALDSDEGEPTEWPVVSKSLRTALDGMIASLRTKEAVKRVSFKIPFVLGKDLSIGIVGYNLIGEETKRLPTKVDLSTAAGVEVITKTVYKDQDTGAELDRKTEVKKYFQVGRADFERGTQASKLFFSDADIRKVKTLGRPPSLKLLGFKPREGHLKVWETIKHSYFAYPDEDRYSGSTRTFASLLKTMVKKDVVGYASFIPRTTSKPQVVLLLPQAEKLSPAGVQVAPPGIHLCQLPFADDMRELGVDMTQTVMHPYGEDSDEEPEQPEVDLCKKIISYMRKPYNPDLYPNPALNFLYETLAAVALNEDLPEPDDRTVPAYETIEQRVGKYMRQLRELIPQDQVDSSRIKVSNQKRAGGSASSSKMAGAASPADEPAPDLSDFADELRETGAKMTVAQLKSALKLMGEKTSGKKDELLERVVAWLEERGLWAEEAGPSKGGKGGKKVEGSDEEMGFGDDGDDEEQEAKPHHHKKKKKRVVVDDEDDG
ncbi:SPOC like C-terminal domain-containing protein [Rhodotorula diobovata]|uniref:ATP-dependent DNA helicase II subunit 1 n=1 Tax=Rhodotorula diobovata TaxID=5288 RepID=A0A5C5FZF9_9BASI|nr:SPOC like C-terminal domain-containing protein [Rhodotorula diobovata]